MGKEHLQVDGLTDVKRKVRADVYWFPVNGKNNFCKLKKIEIKMLLLVTDCK